MVNVTNARTESVHLVVACLILPGTLTISATRSLLVTNRKPYVRMHLWSMRCDDPAAGSEDPVTSQPSDGLILLLLRRSHLRVSYGEYQLQSLAASSDN